MKYQKMADATIKKVLVIGVGFDPSLPPIPDYY